jgi:hypothetical protein
LATALGAPLGFQLCTFLQAGHRSGTSRSASIAAAGGDHVGADDLRRPDVHVGQLHSRNIDPTTLFIIAGSTQVKRALRAFRHSGLMMMMSPFLIMALLSP